MITIEMLQLARKFVPNLNVIDGFDCLYSNNDDEVVPGLVYDLSSLKLGLGQFAIAITSYENVVSYQCIFSNADELDCDLNKVEQFLLEQIQFELS